MGPAGIITLREIVDVAQILMNGNAIPICRNIRFETGPASHAGSPRPGHICNKDHHKNGNNCLPASHACVRVGVSPTGDATRVLAL